MPSNEYLAWAFGGSANVEDHPTYAGDARRTNGHQSGLAPSVVFNTTWRQTSVAAAALAQAVVDIAGVSMLDDGSVANFESGILAMLTAVGGVPSKDLLPTLSNTPSFLTTRVSFSAGVARDSTNAINIPLVAPISKDLTAAWVAGDTNGGRDTGSLANGQTWHCFLIMTNAGVVDALFSQSRNAPTLPATYTKFRRVGAVMLDAAATTIRAFVQFGDKFKLKLRSTDYAAQANGSGSPTLRPFTVPAGIKVTAGIYFQSTGTANTTAYLSGLFDPDFGAPPAFGSPTQWAQIRRGSAEDSTGTPLSYLTVVAEQETDTSQHIYTFSSDSADVIAAGIVYWIDPRPLV